MTSRRLLAVNRRRRVTAHDERRLGVTRGVARMTTISIETSVFCSLTLLLHLGPLLAADRLRRQTEKAPAVLTPSARAIDGVRGLHGGLIKSASTNLE